MALYERLMGLEQPKIPVHAFMGGMQEFMLGNMSAAQATAAFGLDAGEQTEALALRDRLLSFPATTNGIQQRLKGIEFEQVLIMAESGIVPFHTVALVKARLGVP